MCPPEQAAPAERAQAWKLAEVKPALQVQFPELSVLAPV
jgi:hypothetical protein